MWIYMCTHSQRIWYTSFRWIPPWTQVHLWSNINACVCLKIKMCIGFRQFKHKHIYVWRGLHLYRWLPDEYIYIYIYTYIYIYIHIYTFATNRFLNHILESHTYIYIYMLIIKHILVCIGIHALYPPSCGLIWVAALASQAFFAPAIRDLGCVRQIGWDWWPLLGWKAEYTLNW